MYLVSNSVICYGDACLGFQGLGPTLSAREVNKNKRLGGNEKKLLTGRTTISKKQFELTTIMLVSGKY